MTRRTKRTVGGISIALVLLLITVVASPFWLPWVLQPLAKRIGFHYETYERNGYARFVVKNATFTNENVRFRAAHIRGATPTALLWNRTQNGSEFVVDEWSIMLAKKEASDQPRARGPSAIVAQVQKTVRRLSEWVDRAALTNGVVVFQQQTAAVPWLVWEPPRTDARVSTTLPRLGEAPIDLSVRFDDPSRVMANIAAPKFAFHAAVAAVRDGEILIVDATNSWRTNRIVVAARFSDGMLPDTATFSARALRVPAPDMPLRGYGSLHGSAGGKWTNGTFALELDFDAASARPDLPSFAARFAARGNTNSATVETLHLTSGALRAVLSRPVQFSYGGELLGEPARLAVTGDLSRLPLTDLRGAFRGDVDLWPSTSAPAAADFRLTLENVRVRGIELSNVAVRSELRWPWLRVIDLNAHLNSGAELRASAVANVTNRFLSNATVRLHGRLPTNLLHAALSYSNLAIAAEASGPLTGLTHHATLTVDSARFGPMVPLRVEITERGEQFQVAEFRAMATASQGTIEFRGSGRWNATNSTGSLTALKYWRGGTNADPLYTLVSPVNMRFAPAINATRIEIAPLTLNGDQREISARAELNWPVAGNAAFSVAGVRSGDFTNLLSTNLPPAALVSDADARAVWSNGPVWFSLSAITRVVSTAAPPVEVTLKATNTADAIHVSELAARVHVPNAILSPSAKGGPERRKTGSASLVVGEAMLPLSVFGTTNGFSFQLRSNAPLRVELHTSTNDALATLLAEFARVRAVAPAVHVSLGGTLAQPRGAARLSAREVRHGTAANEMIPQVTDLRAGLTFLLDAVRLEDFRANVAGQPVSATAEIPVAVEGDWKSRLQLDRARGELHMRSAELAAFTLFATNLIAPRGTLDVNVALRPGMELSGRVGITNAATAPLPGVGPVHDINAEIWLRDGAAIIESVEAHVGGAPLQITGRVNVAEWKPATNRWPDVRVRIAGTNLALVRQAQKIIRTDIDLQITNVAHGPPGIRGVVNLRDSLFLANLASLIPRGVAAPAQRPPYFSVKHALFGAWPLDVRVQGEEFLTVRTPVFRGEVSANLDVRGVLAEPVAIGQVRIPSGQITFPFATLAVKQGFVTLGSANPYAPDLFITAAGRAYDYDIRLEVTGSAQEPILEFTSVPPLTSEQILLLVTSGQVPRRDFTLSSGQRAQTLGMFVGRNFLSELGFGGGEGNLTVRSGENISERGRSTYSVEYKLTEDVSLVGEYDRFDEYNAGVQWRVFSK